MPSATVYVSLVLLFHLTCVEAKCGKHCHCFLGEKILIPCGINRTYSWPLWRKGKVTIAIEGSSHINPAYAARYSFDTDNQTLIIDKVEKSDAGRYECHHPNGPNSPEVVEVIVEEPLDACLIEIIGIVFLLLPILIQCYILIRTNKKCKQNENKKEDKLKEKIKSMNIRKNVHTVVSILILVIVAVLVIVWFTLKTGDCKKLTKIEHRSYAYLLVGVIIMFVLCAINLLFYICFARKRKNAQGYKTPYAKRTSENHVKGGDTVSIKDNAEMPITGVLLMELDLGFMIKEFIELDDCLSGIPEPTGGDHSPAEQTYFIE